MVHNIVRGDTLSELAQRYNTSVGDLMAANPKIKDADLIYAGDTLNVPGGGGRGAVDGTTSVQNGPVTGNGNNAAAIAQQYLGRDASELKRSGELPMNPNVPSNICCANFVSACLQEAGVINWHTDSVATLRDRLTAEGWQRVDVSQAKPGDVVIMKNARQSHTVLFAGLDANGKPQFIGSNNRNADGTQEISWGGASGDWYILSRPG